MRPDQLPMFFPGHSTRCNWAAQTSNFQHYSGAKMSIIALMQSRQLKDVTAVAIVVIVVKTCMLLSILEEAYVS
jgi:hypothetical protein